MADIAILLAEEYERRTRSFKASNKGDHQEVGLVSACVSVVGERFRGLSDQSRLGEKLKFAVKVLDPKTDLGQEAVNGFFSA